MFLPSDYLRKSLTFRQKSVHFVVFPRPNASVHPLYPAWGISALSFSLHLTLRVFTNLQGKLGKSEASIENEMRGSLAIIKV